MFKFIVEDSILTQFEKVAKDLSFFNNFKLIRHLIYFLNIRKRTLYIWQWNTQCSRMLLVWELNLINQLIIATLLKDLNDMIFPYYTNSRFTSRQELDSRNLSYERNCIVLTERNIENWIYKNWILSRLTGFSRFSKRCFLFQITEIKWNLQGYTGSRSFFHSSV